MHKINFIVSAALLTFLTACGSADEDLTKPPQSAETLYNDAYDQLQQRNVKDAVKSFEEVERQHPASPWAVNAQIMSGFVSYDAQDYITAVSTLERFTKLYPNNESTPYAYYIIALCYYEQITDIGRDQKVTEQALQALREVVRRFPDTQYARDAKVKLDLTQDHLAGKEMEIGRYYLRHDDTLAAVNRFRFVVENFQTTSHVPEALHRLVEAYLKLGVKDEAMRYAAVLGNNFPGNVWYRDSYKLMTKKSLPAATTSDETSWWDGVIP
jgi:outer membrane protein assembly factor BamD